MMTRIDNTKYYKDIAISEAKHAKIIELMEDTKEDFFQSIINEFVVEYDSNVLTEKIIQHLVECKKLAKILIS